MTKILTAVIGLAIAAHSSFANSQLPCLARVESAARVWDYAHKVYQADRAGFLSHINCGRFTGSMGTALHEALHSFVSGGRRTSPTTVEGGHTVWYLPTGEKIPYPGDTGGDPVLNQFPPRLAADLVKTRDPGLTGYDFYLLGTRPISSSEDFNKMLDELNSYASDARFVVKLIESGYPNDGSSSSGLFALAVMVRAYLAAAERDNPAAWARLRRPDYTNAIRKIWENGEIAIKAMCSRPDIMRKGINQKWVRELVENRTAGPLEAVLGRRVDLPSACPSSGQRKTPVEAPVTVETPAPVPPSPASSGGGGDQFQITIQ